ncbi:F-box protein KIB4-like [Aegilops tauschii subsp. strangulata]|uniref:F-box domain-containing protein n=4 Tax=Aegilops tauschii TaxID=37682 RepID=A0A453DWU2_AEGTS|nr:putative F-box protein At4g22660 [Aegilops tauschii subsp. strangulata]
METCSLARIIKLQDLVAMYRQKLCSLVFRSLPRLLLGFPPSSIRKFFRDEHVHVALAETKMVATLPELPQDILMVIFAALEIPDLMRAGSVCSSWHSAYAELRSLGKYKQGQTPCLVYSSESDPDDVLSLYSLAEKKSYKLSLPQPPIRSRYLIGSSHGWLVTVDERSDMHLLNPITCEQIALPSVSTIEHLKPIFDEYGDVCKYEMSGHSGSHNSYNPPFIFALAELRDRLQWKAFVFPDTSTGSYIVVLIHNPQAQLSFAKAGDDKWTWLPPHYLHEDCMYKDGILYAVNTKGEIHAFDLSGPVVTVKTIITAPEHYDCDSRYIVQAPWGSLLLVFRIVHDHDLEYEYWKTTETKICEIDALWNKIELTNCLRDHVLFLGHNLSLCLSADEYPALKANCSYFTDDNFLWTVGYKNNHRDVGILKLNDKSREEFVSPQLWSNCPAPMWITPDLRKINAMGSMSQQL